LSEPPARTRHSHAKLPPPFTTCLDEEEGEKLGGVRPRLEGIPPGEGEIFGKVIRVTHVLAELVQLALGR